MTKAKRIVSYPSQEELRELLDYNEDTGLFYWRKHRFRHLVGRVAGGGHSAGYRRIIIDNTHYFAHRCAWIYVYGKEPNGFIDHINGIRSDNRISNIRECEHWQNMQNVAKTTRPDAKSKYIGVSYNAKTGKWCAKIQVRYKKYSLGYHETQLLAHAAYLEAKRNLHKFNPELRRFANAR